MPVGVWTVLIVCAEWLNSEPKSRFPLNDYITKHGAGKQTGYCQMPYYLGIAIPVDRLGKQVMHKL